MQYAHSITVFRSCVEASIVSTEGRIRISNFFFLLVFSFRSDFPQRGSERDETMSDEGMHACIELSKWNSWLLRNRDYAEPAIETTEGYSSPPNVESMKSVIAMNVRKRRKLSLLEANVRLWGRASFRAWHDETDSITSEWRATMFPAVCYEPALYVKSLFLVITRKWKVSKTALNARDITAIFELTFNVKMYTI